MESTAKMSVPLTPQYEGELLEDCMILARYAIQAGLLSTPETLERLLILKKMSSKSPLDEKALAELARYYEELVRTTGKVTPDSLRATEKVSEHYWASITGRHLVKLWTITALVGLMIFLYVVLDYRVSYYDAEEGSDRHLLWIRIQQYASFVIPFVYGALGTCAYLLRAAEQDLATREFDPNRIPQHWNRLVLGTLSGGLIVMFINQVPDAKVSVVQISEGALGFLAGYSIDFLFTTLDRLVSAIIPQKEANTVDKKQVQREKSQLVGRFQQKLKKAEDPEIKKVLTEVISDLR